MVDVTAIRAVRYARDTHGSTDLSGKLSPPYMALTRPCELVGRGACQQRGACGPSSWR